MKSSPALPGGSLMSKPTWSNTFGCSATSAFFVLGDVKLSSTRRKKRHEKARSNHDAAGRTGGQRLPTASDWLRTQSRDRGPKRGHGGRYATRGAVAGLTCCEM